MTPHCLSRETLAALLEDRLPEPQRKSAEAHFSACADCQQATEELYAELNADCVPVEEIPVGAIEAGPTDLRSFLRQLKRLTPRDDEPHQPADSFAAAAPTARELETVALGASAAGDGRNDTDTALGHPDGALGTSIGPYRLIERLGQGGFGIVYRAEQRHPIVLTVALKVIKPGMDSREVIARFQTERQALALMDHPHIARVLNAGTTHDGRPYFVMELVDGLLLTEYCDQHRLTITRRLELFVTVCEAVQHAHQKGIIHRDLKPSNVLVADREGAPDVKVIDFGIAKALTQSLADGTAMTLAGQMIGTPLYMSPEQVGTSGVDVDTRSDVYSLGVLLYELLTGTTPFERERLKKLDLRDALRIVEEEEPPRPSSRLTTQHGTSETVAQQRDTSPRELLRQLRSDLDWIVVKALEKDRDRRYQSASALAAEITRVLNHEPVEACPPTTVYRVRKYVRRNSLALGTATIVGTALVTGTGVALWQAQRAENERSRADQKASAATLAEQRAGVKEREALREAEKSAAGLYAEQIGRAYDHQQAGDQEQAHALLDNWIPQPGQTDHRGLEWGLLMQRLRVPGDELLQLTSPPLPDGTVTHDVSCVRLSPDGTYLVAATDGGVVRRYSLADNRELPPWESKLFDVRRMAFSPHGKWLALISYEAETVAIDAATGLVRHRFPKPELFDQHTDVTFWNDDVLIAFRRGDVLKTWNLSQGGALRTWHTHTTQVFDLAVNRQRPLIAMLVDHTPANHAVKFFSKPLGKESQPPVLVDIDAYVLALSHDGRYLAVGTKMGGVQIWDHAAPKLMAEMSRQEKIEELTFSADDQLLALAERTGTITVWQWDHPDEPQLEYRGPIQHVTSEANGAITVAAASGRTLRLGSEFRVNTHTADQQFISPASAAMDANGNFVLTWTSRTQDDSGRGVYGQCFDASGALRGGEFHINNFTTGEQVDPAVAMNARGEFVVTWSSNKQDGSGYGVYARLYDAQGTPQAKEFLVNRNHRADDQDVSTVAMAAGGEFVITWSSNNQDGSGWGIYAQRFDAAGVAQGRDVRVNTCTTGDQRYSKVAMAADGSFVITWFSKEQDGSGCGVYGQRFNAAGEPQGAEFLVNTHTTGDQWAPAVAVAAHGEFVIAWDSVGQDGSGRGIYAQRYDAAGTPRGNEFLVNTETMDDQLGPTVAIAADGGFVVVWNSIGQDGESGGIYAQRYDAAGVPLGDEFPVNNLTLGEQDGAPVAMNAQGDFVIAWHSDQPAESQRDVYARLFRADDERLRRLNTAVASQRTVHVVQDHRGWLSVDLLDPSTDVATEEAVPNRLLGEQWRTRDRPALVHWQAHPRPARSVVFGPDKRQVFTAGIDGRIVRWDWDRREARRLPTSPYFTAWVPGRHALASSENGSFRLYDCQTGKQHPTPTALQGTNINDLACNSDGSFLAWTTDPGHVYCWTPFTEQTPVPLSESSVKDGQFPVLNFLPQSNLLVALESTHLQLSCWDVETGKLVSQQSLPPVTLRSSVLTQRNPALCLVTDDALLLLDPLTGAELQRHPFDGRAARALAASPSDNLLAIGRNRQIELVDAVTGQLRPPLVGHLGQLKQLEFAPDGKTLLALDSKGVLKLWQVAHGLQLLTWQSPDPIRRFRLSPDGRRLALVYEKETEIVEIAPNE